MDLKKLKDSPRIMGPLDITGPLAEFCIQLKKLPERIKEEMAR